MREFGKITLFGDSIPKGYTTKGGKIEKVDKDAVSNLEEKYGFKIENRSVYGQTLNKLYERGVIDRYLEETAGQSGRTAVFCIGGNDSDYDWKAVAAAPKAFHQSKTPLNVFERELDELIGKLQNDGVNVLLTTLTPVDSARYFEQVISRIADGEKVLEFLSGDITNINRHQECYNLAVIGAAVKNKCRIIDIRSEFLMQTNYLVNYSEDGIHPNAGGHAVIAKSVMKFIDEKVSA